MKTEIEPERLLDTIEEVGFLTQIGRTTLYNLVKSGDLPSIRVGASTRIPKASLAAWIAAKLQENVGDN